LVAALPRYGISPDKGREAKQGEVGLVVGDEYFAIRQFEEA
jgi:hypothetical protein